MTRIFTTMICLCLAMAVNAQNMAPVKAKLSPTTRKLLREIDKQGADKQVPDGYIFRKINGTDFVSGMIQVLNSGTVAEKLEEMGVLVGTKAGNIWTVNIPYAKTKAFTQVEGISYIQLDEPLRPTMDVALKVTRADSVHQGIGLLWPMTGKGIIMGVIDFGFDYGHPGFFDANGTTNRISKVWELNSTGTPPAGFSYGRELVGSSAILAAGTDNAEQMHGTGVAGIAAGSGLGTPNLMHKGFAYDAEMVFVGVRRDTIGTQWLQSSFSDFVDGVNYIFQQSTAAGKPAVTNISWGSQSGPHDGTSLFSQACDNLSGPGKVIVMSAGNDGQENIHIYKKFTPADTLIQTFVTFSDDTMKRTWIDIWGDTAKTFSAQVTLYSKGIAGQTTGFVPINDLDSATILMGVNGLDTCFVEFLTSSSEYNSKPRITVDIYNKAVDSIHIAIKATDGSIDAWNESYYYGYKYRYSSLFESLGVPGNVNGNANSTVSDMGSAKSVLLVGAWSSKTQWTDINGIGRVLVGTDGDIAYFSSKGPMADGRIKPDIAAPGMVMASPTSSYDTRYTETGINSVYVMNSYTFNSKKYYYAGFLGTSASAPAASGIVAMMLQANPKLTPTQVRDMIGNTAITDFFTGNLPATGNNTWGRGKINAYAAVKAAAAANSVYTVKGVQPDCALFPNPNNGQFSLAYTGTEKQMVNVTVTDVTGRTIATEGWSVNAGDNVHTFNFPQLSKGTYFVNVADKGGSINIKTTIQ